MEQQSFGFAGVGRMGSLMAPRLLDAGHSVHVFDVSKDAVAAMEKAGAKSAASMAELGDKADTVFLSLPNPEIVQQCRPRQGRRDRGHTRQARGGFLHHRPAHGGHRRQGARRSATSSMSMRPSAAASRARAKARWRSWCRVPKTVYTELEPVLKTFGKPFHLGEVRRTGADHEARQQSAGRGRHRAVFRSDGHGRQGRARSEGDARCAQRRHRAATARPQDKFPRSILPGTFDFGFATGLSYKDVRLCIDEAESLGVPMVCGAAVRQMLAVTNAMYGADSDFTSICRVVESWAGVEVRG